MKLRHGNGKIKPSDPGCRARPSSFRNLSSQNFGNIRVDITETDTSRYLSVKVTDPVGSSKLHHLLIRINSAVHEAGYSVEVRNPEFESGPYTPGFMVKESADSASALAGVELHSHKGSDGEKQTLFVNMKPNDPINAVVQGVVDEFVEGNQSS